MRSTTKEFDLIRIACCLSCVDTIPQAIDIIKKTPSSSFYCFDIVDNKRTSLFHIIMMYCVESELTYVWNECCQRMSEYGKNRVLSNSYLDENRKTPAYYLVRRFQQTSCLKPPTQQFIKSILCRPRVEAHGLVRYLNEEMKQNLVMTSTNQRLPEDIERLISSYL